MRTRFVEATQGVEDGFNHGKFMVGLFSFSEWHRPSEIVRRYAELRTGPLLNDLHVPRLLRRCGWTEQHALVLDLQTGEGAMFFPSGSASADLDKHKVWVCPMFEPFLSWLYEHVREHGWEPDAERPLDPVWFVRLPEVVELPGAEGALYGYRRGGPEASR